VTLPRHRERAPNALQHPPRPVRACRQTDHVSPSVTWPDEVLSARSAELAESILALLASGTRWRHRRVETVDPVSATSVRRHVSLDFTIPAELHDGLRLPVRPDRKRNADQFIVPLGWLARRQLVSFDLRDGGGRAVPMLLGAQIATLTRDLLLLAAVEAGLDPGDESRADQAIDVAVAASRDQPIADSQTLIQQAAALSLRPDFTSLVRSSTQGFLMLAVLPEIEGRRVVKWQTDELRRPTSSWRRVLIDAEMPGINESASTHVELKLPDALHAVTFELLDRRDGGPGRPPAIVPLPHDMRAPATSREQPRLLLRPVASAQGPRVSADIVVTSSGFLIPALALALLAILIVIVGLVSHVEHILPTDSSTAPSVLLGAFSVGFGLFLRTEEHQLIRAMLAPARAALGTMAVALALAAVPVAFHLPRDWILAAWWVALAVNVLALFVVWWTTMEHTEWGRKLG
jgi:hypothetical protein